jgi:hypothetical protein
MDTPVDILIQELTIMFSLEQTCSILAVKIESANLLTSALISHGIDGLTIIEYFLVAHYYLSKNQPIGFMQEFIEMRDKQDKFCVPHMRLCELGIVQERDDGKGRMKNIIECLTKTNGFEEEKDFEVITEGRAKKIMMKPKVFKTCLLKSRNTDIFRNYYRYRRMI